MSPSNSADLCALCPLYRWVERCTTHGRTIPFLRQRGLLVAILAPVLVSVTAVHFTIEFCVLDEHLKKIHNASIILKKIQEFSYTVDSVILFEKVVVKNIVKPNRRKSDIVTSRHDQNWVNQSVLNCSKTRT